MKILEISYGCYYYYPEGMTCIKDFIDYINSNYNSFIELTAFDTENCVFPYLVKEDTTQVYVNVASLERLQEVEATIMSRDEYDRRLKEIVEKKCIDCVHYKEDSEGDNLEGHRRNICLDGKCFLYRKNETE